MIPKIEDGNNFGVSVQEETLEEIQSVESEAATYFDQISRYHATRAKLVSKVRALVSKLFSREFQLVFLNLAQQKDVLDILVQRGLSLLLSIGA